MTITDTKLFRETSTATRAGISYKRRILVTFTGGYNAHTLQAATDGGGLLLKNGADHPDDSASYVTNVATTDPLDDGDDPQSGQCYYDIDFSPKTADFALNPLDRPPEINWGAGEDQTEVMYRDYDDLPVQNSAKDRYDPMPENDVPGADVTISRFEADNPADLIAVYSKSTNDAGLWGQDKDSLKLGKITAAKVFENNVAYWKVTYPIFLNYNGWRLLLVDNGHRKVTTGGKLRRIHDDVGQTSPVPVFLDGHGAELDPAADPVIYPSIALGATDDGYRRYPSLPWGVLSLPNPWA